MALPLSTLTFFLLLFTSPSHSTTIYNTTTLNTITTLCQSSPYPSSCFTSLKLSISISLPPLLSFLLQSLNSAISQTTSLLPLLSSPNLNLISHQKGTLQDCIDLHHITISSLHKSSNIITNNVASNKALNDIKTHLSAALTNKNTCLEGLESASGSSKEELLSSWANAYRSVSNSLYIASKKHGLGTESKGKGRRRLMGFFPRWVKGKERRLLQSGDYEGYDPSSVCVYFGF